MRYLFLILIGLSVGGCKKAETPPVADGGLNFTIKDLEGREVSLAEFRGKTVILNIWATWCKPCIREIPDLKAIHDEMKSKDVMVLGVLLESGSAEEAKPIVVQQLQIHYPVWYGDDSFARLFQVEAFPTTVIIDKQGKALKVMVGAQTRERLLAVLKSIGI